MPENKELEQLERIAETLDNVRDDVGSLTTSQAVQTEQLKAIVGRLDKVNGRLGKSEDRISSLETNEAERRGAWKLMLIVASIPASIVGAVAVWVAQHSGGK